MPRGSNWVMAFSLTDSRPKMNGSDFGDGLGQMVDHDSAPIDQERRSASGFDARQHLTRRRTCGQQTGDGAKQSRALGAHQFHELKFEGRHNLYSALDGQIRQLRAQK